MADNETIRKTCESLIDETTAFLDRLVRFESLPGYEGPAIDWVYEHLMVKDYADICEKVPIPEDIVNDPEYQFTLDDRPYEGRPNIRAVIKGDGTGKSVIFNAHVDVVPPSTGHERPFDPYVKDGALYGRGASDDKGQVAVMWTMLMAMKKLGIRPKGDVIFHIVVEEETGGNGSLAFARAGDKADCCINLDAGEGIYTSSRGAVWFTGTVHGRAGHSSEVHTTVSALKMAIEAMNIIEEYHDELLAETINDDPLFSGMENPMPVTFGQLEAGDWPAMAPQKAVFKGVFGMLTTPKEEVMQQMVERVKTRGPEWLKDNFEMTFEYHHDISRIDPDLPFVMLLRKCYGDMGIDMPVKALPASNDACFYTNISGIPTAATGMMEIGTAHTNYEHVILNKLITEAAVMVQFIREWCGLK